MVGTLAEEEGPRYRPEIDGLRAVAVLAVVLFHAGAPGFAGGFVGVDIFFVISGFLITTIIAGQVERQSFSFAGFYERRARRILPAFFVMLAFCCIVAPVVLMPEDYQAFVDSVVASVLFVANMLFARHYDYFGQAPIFDPLLHTWSLGVEEQFYIGLPILLVIVHRLRPAWARGVVAILAVASLGLSIWLVQRQPMMAFYLAPMRAWELLLGSLLALGAVPAVHRRLLPGMLTAAGLVLLAGSILLLSEDLPFPGVNALYPCLGAALVIHGEGHGGSAVGRLLRLHWLVFVGLISYSLYLWHWPLLVFAKYYIIRPLLPVETAGLVAAAFAMAVLSWRFVERPFRRSAGVLQRRAVFAAAGALMAMFVLVGGIGDRAGAAGVVTAFLRAGQERHPYRNPDIDRCLGGLHTRQSRTVADVEARRLCPLGDAAAATPSFVLWGDSHAEALRAGVDAAARTRRVAGYFAGWADCPPALGVEVFELAEGNGCRRFNDAVLALLRDPAITTVVLHARWARLFHGTKYPGELSARPLALQGNDGGTNEEVLARGLRATVDALERLGKRVVVIAGVPEVGIDVPSFLARAQYMRRDVQIDLHLADYMQRNAAVLRMVRNISVGPDVTVLYPHRFMCDTAICRTSRDGRPLYHDDDHLSVDGALSLRPMLERMLDQVRLTQR